MKLLKAFKWKPPDSSFNEIPMKTMPESTKVTASVNESWGNICTACNHIESITKGFDHDNAVNVFTPTIADQNAKDIFLSPN